MLDTTARSRILGAALAVTALIGVGLAVTPTPCWATSCPTGGLAIPELLTLELVEITVDGQPITPDPIYDQFDLEIHADPNGTGVFLAVDDGGGVTDRWRFFR